jgi:hypothetical protein
LYVMSKSNAASVELAVLLTCTAMVLVPVGSRKASRTHQL